MTQLYRYGLIGNICRAAMVKDFNACLIRNTNGVTVVFDNQYCRFRNINESGIFFDSMAIGVDGIEWISLNNVVDRNGHDVDDYTVIVEAKAGEVILTGSTLLRIMTRTILHNQHYLYSRYVIRSQRQSNGAFRPKIEEFR
ncbi:MAG: hypothetical protein WC284_09235 [Candidimonas sp.]